MTTIQKIIKYLAIAFAIFLTISIISGVVGVLRIVTGISESKDAILEDMKTYKVSQNITDLKIEISAADFTVKSGEKFAIESNLKNLKVVEKDGKLSISEKSKLVWKTNYKGATLVVYIPKDFSFDNADIIAGAGKLTLDTFTAEKLNLELGAGQARISNLTVNRKSKIDGGAGEVVVKDSTLNNLDLDMGVGELKLTAAIYGESQLDLGVGKTKITLLGDKDDYRLEFEKGVGNAAVEGKNVTDDEIYGNGANEIEINSGVGSVDVVFDAK